MDVVTAAAREIAGFLQLGALGGEADFSEAQEEVAGQAWDSKGFKARVDGWQAGD